MEKNQKCIPEYAKVLGKGQFAGMAMPIHRYQCIRCKGGIRRSAFGAPKCPKCGCLMSRID